MRFNERTCLEFLHSGIACDLHFPKDSFNEWDRENLSRHIKAVINNGKPHFGRNVQFITMPFFDAYKKAANKVFDLLKEETLGSMAGTFIVPVGGGAVKTIFYALENYTPGKVKGLYLEFIRSKEYEETRCEAVFSIDSKDEPDNTALRYYMSDGYEQIGATCTDFVWSFLCMLGFLKFCDIETKIIVPKEKYRDSKKNRYFNETKSKIEILDSTWFTTIVRDEDFEVSGHFRLQPYGPGRRNKRWIYINDFTKHGYVRRAKKSE